MKVSFFEGEYGAQISLVPETVEEISALGRMTLNAKAEKPEIRFYFSQSGPSCNIWLKSVAKPARKTSITNIKNKYNQ